MINAFLVRDDEMFLLDEQDFIAHGGENLSFGALELGVVELYASGSAESIRRLATNIICHHTAAR